MKLATQRLELVAATPALLRAELESLPALALALGVATPEIWPPPLNTRETLDYTLRFLEGGADREGWMSWYFILREGRALAGRQGRVLVGQGGYAGVPSAGSVEVGYSILEAQQRRGYATEAVSALIEHAFSFPSIDTVTAQTLPDLTPSIGVLRKLGFDFAGPGSEEGAIKYVLPRARR